MSSDSSNVDQYYKGLGYVAATLGMIQGIAWMVLAIMAILLYTEAWTPQMDQSTSYGQLLGNKILERYFIGSHPKNLYVGPAEFFVCCIVYLIVSLVWTGISFFQFWVIFRKKYPLVKNICSSWCSWSILLCLYDLVWASFLAHDYDQVVREINEKDTVDKNDYLTISAHGIVMTLVARGFVLWCVNLIVAIAILRIANITLSEIQSDQDLINAFEIRPNSWKSDSRTSFTNGKSFSTFRGIPRITPVQSTNAALLQYSETKATHLPNSNSIRKSDGFNYLVGVSSADIHQRPFSPSNSFLKNRY